MLTKTPTANDILSQSTRLTLAGAPTISASWRRRLTMLAMSLVVGWHSLAMFVAPAPPNSAMVQSLRALVQPYISLLRLDSGWGFFAPVGKHAEFRYDIRDAAGNNHVFLPSDAPAGSIPKYVWWREWKYLFDGIMESAEGRAGSLGPLLCQQHADLDPIFVTLYRIMEQDYQPDDLLNGKHPLDPEFVDVQTLVRIPCRSSPIIPHRGVIRPRRPT